MFHGQTMVKSRKCLIYNESLFPVIVFTGSKGKEGSLLADLVRSTWYAYRDPLNAHTRLSAVALASFRINNQA